MRRFGRFWGIRPRRSAQKGDFEGKRGSYLKFIPIFCGICIIFSSARTNVVRFAIELSLRYTLLPATLKGVVHPLPLAFVLGPQTGQFWGMAGSILGEFRPVWGLFGIKVWPANHPILGDSGPKLGPPGGLF